ncbi:MAG: aldehyde dehydrogenase family protein, partial [Gemmatimonadales bacterium]
MQRLLIADRRPGGPGVIRVVEPATGEPFEEVASAGPAELEAAVAAAKAALPGWAGGTAVARADVL